MNRGKRTLSLTLTSLLIMATMLIVAYTPSVSSSPTPQHTATVTPTTTTLPTVTLTFNVTCKAESINKTSIILPDGFTPVSARARNDTGRWGVQWVSAKNLTTFL